MATTYQVSFGATRYPILDSYIKGQSRVSIIIGPLGSGKSTASAQRLARIAMEQTPNENGVRPTRFCAVRNTFPQLSNTTIRDFSETWKGWGKLKWSKPPTFHAVFDLEDGTRVDSETIFLALDTPDDVDKLLSTQFTAFWFNEVCEIDKAIFDMADLRHGRYPSKAQGDVDCSWRGTIADTNAFDQDLWLYPLVEDEIPNGWTVYTQPPGVLPTVRNRLGTMGWKANPEAENLHHLPFDCSNTEKCGWTGTGRNLDGGLCPHCGSEVVDYYMSGVGGKDEEWIRVKLANEWGSVFEGKPVHPEYHDHVHCPGIELAADPKQPLVVGIDFGRTPAAVVCQRSPQSPSRWHILDEFCMTDMSASLFGPELKRFLDREYPGLEVIAWGDPAGDSAGQTVEQSPIDLINAAGIRCLPAATNQVVYRRRALAGPCTRTNPMDGLPDLVVDPHKPKMFRKGMSGGFHFRRLQVPGRGDRYVETPEKNEFSHPVEACEYALMSEGELHGARTMPSYDQGLDDSPQRQTAIM